MLHILRDNNTIQHSARLGTTCWELTLSRAYLAGCFVRLSLSGLNSIAQGNDGCMSNCREVVAAHLGYHLAIGLVSLTIISPLVS
jgi:hypothetical protein